MYMTTYNTRYQSLVLLERLKLDIMKEYLPNFIESINNKRHNLYCFNDTTDKEIKGSPRRKKKHSKSTGYPIFHMKNE